MMVTYIDAKLLKLFFNYVLVKEFHILCLYFMSGRNIKLIKKVSEYSINL